VKIEELYKVEGFGAVVTGGASGLGLGFAEVMAENGARVTLLDVSKERIDTEVKRLRGQGLDVEGAVVDVTDHGSLDAAIDAAAAKYGRLDAVFANAGIDSGPGYVKGWVFEGRTRDNDGALENYTDARWQKVIDINLTGVFATIRAAVRHMKPRKFGRIVVTTSMAATHTEPSIGMAYMVSKAGAAHLTRNAALELAAYNITVNAIAPGFIITNIGGGHAYNPDLQKMVSKYIPMHRVGFPNDLKGLALFLASPASSYVTGQQIGIDGGWSLGQAD
jgi:NAD(P)-dependent dehydrogenase (short-subunit alcohol dehydrogenase family)